MTSLVPQGRMRIAMFFWSLEHGGVEHMMVTLSRELAARGHDVSLLLARSPQPNEHLPDPSVRVIRFHAKNTLQAVFSLSRHLADQNYDVLYTAMPTTNVATIAALRLSRAKTRLVISERSNPSLEAKHSKTWRYRAAFSLQPFFYPRADAIVAVCRDLADDLAAFARLPRDSIRVIYNPAFDNRTANLPSSITHPWLDEKTCPVIVSAGRLSLQKDLPTLLRAFAQLRRQQPAKLIILGEGPLRSELESLAGQLGLTEDVALHGFISDISPFLRKADVFALTSIWEGFGNVLVQALGAGCTIVSTDCRNGPREILDDGAFGKLVPVGDVSAFASALIAAVASPSDPRQQISRAGLFSASRSAEAYEGLFQSLLVAGT